MNSAQIIFFGVEWFDQSLHDPFTKEVFAHRVEKRATDSAVNEALPVPEKPKHGLD